MPKRDAASLNTLIDGLAQGSPTRDALGLFKRMRVEGVRANEVTVLGALLACSQLGPWWRGRCGGVCGEEGLDGNVQVCNPLIDVYVKCGQ
ncbi:hypothetical protein Scep_012338 [Stephania cephalantha]|uniref:Pentatricopeptide repeat-containing protein n=1 Tax=Stephania cephalantha TaxID=152367 RepID=A0AAP0JGX5_9MAGN